MVNSGMILNLLKPGTPTVRRRHGAIGVVEIRHDAPSAKSGGLDADGFLRDAARALAQLERGERRALVVAQAFQRLELDRETAV